MGRKYFWTNRKDTSSDEFFPNMTKCIEDAVRAKCSPLYVGEVEEPEIGMDYMDDLLRKVTEDIQNEFGDVAEDWDIYTTTGDFAFRQPIYDKCNEKLNQLIKDYIADIGEEPRFFKVTNLWEVN